MDYREEYAETLVIEEYEREQGLHRFRQLAEAEHKAKFIQALIDKSQGHFSRTRAETIANHCPLTINGDDEHLAESIVMHDNAKSFAKAATLQHTGTIHSWAGEKTFDEYGNWIIGDGEFGLHRHVVYSNNGAIGSPETEDVSVDFDLTKTQVVAIKSVYHNSLNQDATYHEEEWKLHVLPANSEYSKEKE